MLWDYSQLKGPKLVVKLATYYSTSEVLTFKHQEKFEEDEVKKPEMVERITADKVKNVLKHLRLLFMIKKVPKEFMVSYLLKDAEL